MMDGSSLSLSWYEWILIGGALVTALGAIWVKAVVPIFNALKAIEKFYPLLPVITNIAKEFQNNGGSSLKDSIENIDEKVDCLSEEFQDVKHNVKKVKDSLEEDITEIETSLKVLKENSIRTREGKAYSGVESRKKYLNPFRRGQRLLSKQK
jgi:chemotaxis response regulator CheB